LEEWAPRDFDYKEFMRGLASIASMPLCPGCLKGGGRDNCEVRACASNKNIEGCSKCRESELCQHVEILERMRSGALAAGLLVEAEEVDREQILEEGVAELKSRWPCCILFMNG
jgi:hypothetical protein